MSESLYPTLNEIPASVFELESSPPTDLLTTLTHFVASAEAAVVFSSLAKLCVPAFSDACTLEIVQADGAAYRISYPRTHTDSSRRVASRADLGVNVAGPSQGPGDGEVRTQIGVPAASGHPGYAGVLVHSWAEHAPTASDTVIAQLLVGLAVSSIQQERLADLLHETQNRVTNFDDAVASHGQIGIALGILMVNHKITEEQAFDLLRTVSQTTHRKLRDVAADVKDTGWLDSPANPDRHSAAGPPRC